MIIYFISTQITKHFSQIEKNITIEWCEWCNKQNLKVSKFRFYRKCETMKSSHIFQKRRRWFDSEWWRRVWEIHSLEVLLFLLHEVHQFLTVRRLTIILHLTRKPKQLKTISQCFEIHENSQRAPQHAEHVSLGIDGST